MSYAIASFPPQSIISEINQDIAGLVAECDDSWYVIEKTCRLITFSLI